MTFFLLHMYARIGWEKQPQTVRNNYSLQQIMQSKAPKEEEKKKDNFVLPYDCPFLCL